MKAAPIRILLVEDSPAQRELLLGMLNTAPEFTVVGIARSGAEAITAAQRLRPHVIAMDIVLPDFDGYEVTRQIMQLCPTPVVLISSDGTATQRTGDALAVGALSVIRKPGGMSTPTYQSDRANFLTTLRLMAGVPVVTRHAPRAAVPATPRLTNTPEILALAASTGGPLALQTVLRGLGADFPIPVLVVQHITLGFTEALVAWLATTVPLPIHLATSGQSLEPGHVYIAPDDRHLFIQSRGMVALRSAEPDDRFCPSADMLFNSLATVYQHQALGVVLTGMGDDGTRGLQALAAAGSVTLAQDEASCVVYGMPRAAIAAGAITRVVALNELASTLRRLAGCPLLLNQRAE